MSLDKIDQNKREPMGKSLEIFRHAIMHPNEGKVQRRERDQIWRVQRYNEKSTIVLCNKSSLVVSIWNDDWRRSIFRTCTCTSTCMCSVSPPKYLEVCRFAYVLSVILVYSKGNWWLVGSVVYQTVWFRISKSGSVMVVYERSLKFA